MTGALPRHTLVWPAVSARQHLAAQLTDDAARAALDTWFREGLPLVVRRVDDPVRVRPPGIALGLPLPPAQGKRRLAFQLAHGDVAHHTFPPALDRIAAALPAPWRGPLAALASDARALGVTLRGFGSTAWQAITGLAYLRDESDVDLLFRPASAAQLEATLALFERWEQQTRRRIDAEIVFAGDDAVAWREWRGVGESSRLLVKTIAGAALVPRAQLLERFATVPA